MNKFSINFIVLAIASTLAAEPLLGFGKNSNLIIETRTIDNIYKAALAEGGTLLYGMVAMRRTRTPSKLRLRYASPV
jgi:hypothetical protein